MHENMKINAKGRVKWTYRLRERKNLAKIWEENDKNLMNELVRVEERKKSLKKFWKRWVEQVKIRFLKTLFTIFDWSKINFDWSKQTKAPLNFLKTILIDRKTNSINRNNRNSLKFWEKNTVLKKNKTHFRNTSKHWNWWTKCMSMWWNVFQKQ